MSIRRCAKTKPRNRAFVLAIISALMFAANVPVHASASVQTNVVYWLTELYGHTITDSTLELTFRSDGTLTATDGCNANSGSWTDDDNGLRVILGASTAVGCSGATLAGLALTEMQRAPGRSNENGIAFGSDSAPVLVLSPAPANRWLANTTFTGPQKASLQFKSNEAVLSLPCGTATGSIKVTSQSAIFGRWSYKGCVSKLRSVAATLPKTLRHDSMIKLNKRWTSNAALGELAGTSWKLRPGSPGPETLTFGRNGVLKTTSLPITGGNRCEYDYRENGAGVSVLSVEQRTKGPSPAECFSFEFPWFTRTTDGLTIADGTFAEWRFDRASTS